MDITETPANVSRPTPRLMRVFRAKERSGQAIVEFALVSMAFFSITLGTIDLGRGVFEYHQLSNAVREGAHFGKISPPDTAGIKGAVMEFAPSLGLTAASIPDPKCTGGCYQGCADITVSAQSEFKPLLSSLLGLPEEYSTITMSSTVTVETE